MMKISTLIIAIILLAGIGIQFITPDIVNPPVTGELNTPASVTQIFERACYDCHSNKTQLKWYDKIAPISWKVAKDVQEARSRFNFSEWDKLSETEQQTTLWKTVNAIIAGKMPLKSYAAVHPAANISAAEIETLKTYVNTLPNNKTNDVKAAVDEWRNYRRENTILNTIPVALNGVKYVTDYKQWQVISSTNRFDNSTIRVVYGNDITVKAIKENKTNPFPNGATIAKVVWNKIEDKDGNIRPGTFNAVQIMTKDDDRYPKTGGWGFAIFSGLKLKPFGKTISFQSTCFNCHKQLASENGYVFNVPLKNSELNKKIMSATREMFDAGGQQVITSSASQKQGTVSVLYGNRAALQAVLDSSGKHTSGEAFTLATWEQIDHPYWYGSHINGRLKTVETVSVNNNQTFEYKILNGATPKDIRERINFILHQQASVFPSKP